LEATAKCHVEADRGHAASVPLPAGGHRPNAGAGIAAQTLRERVLVVDDDEQILVLLNRILSRAGYRCTSAADVAEACARLDQAPFEVVLCDVLLPGGSGLDVAAYALAGDRKIAVAMMSGLDDVDLADRALAGGACGYMLKPFTANDVLRTVLGAADRRRRDLDVREELRASSEETIRRLCIAVEARDQDTAAHVTQMSEYCRWIALELGLPADECDLIRTAAAMHDVGKLGIPDHIMLKPGRLTGTERRVMQQHAEIGYRILGGSRAELLQTAATIAWTHHERIDGTGYPRGLSGQAIPLHGRIAAVADVFDALTRDRVYRRRYTQTRALEILEAGRGTHVDPTVLDVFVHVLRRTEPPA
jgi:putative two-component system response regulator